MSFTLRPAIKGGAVAFALLLAACSSPSVAGGDDDTEETVTVTVGTLAGQPQLYQPFLYEQFGPDNYEFNVITLDTTPDLNDALISGSVDFAVTGWTPGISTISEGRDLTFIAGAADGGTGFVGQPGMTDLNDLIGATVAVIPTSSMQVQFLLTLEDQGIDPADMEIITLAPADMFNALTTGSVDAFAGAEIAVSLAVQAGHPVLADPYQTEVGAMNLGFATTGALIEEDPELVQAVVDTHRATIDHMNSDSEWVEEMIATFGGDQEIVEMALENFDLRWDLPEDYLPQIEAFAVQMQELRMITATPSLDEIVDTSFLDGQ